MTDRAWIRARSRINEFVLIKEEDVQFSLSSDGGAIQARVKFRTIRNLSSPSVVHEESGELLECGGRLETPTRVVESEGYARRPVSQVGQYLALVYRDERGQLFCDRRFAISKNGDIVSDPKDSRLRGWDVRRIERVIGDAVRDVAARAPVF